MDTNKKTIKKVALLMPLLLLCSCLNVAAMGAGGNDSKAVRENIREEIRKEIMQAQDSYYAGVYDFDNWKFQFDNETLDGTVYETDVSVSADMILVRPYDKSPYYQGLMSAYDSTDTAQKKNAAAIEAVAAEYKSIVEEHYLQPYETGFMYRAEVTDTKGGISIQLYRGINQGEEYSWEKVEKEDRFCDLATYENGAEMARKVVERQTRAAAGTTSSGYYAIGAVEYARAHATDEPEFNKKDGSGSDCANFVSKCIHAGGIPIDTDGGWYPAKTWGDPRTAGINWIRTGHYDGGIKTYFLDKGYIFEVPVSSVSIGCIMYWNGANDSHVAIVTYYDGSTIKYSQHSNVKKDSTYYTYTTEDVTFFLFN